MIKNETILFPHNGKTFSILVEYRNAGYEVRVFLDGESVSPFVYRVDINNSATFEETFGSRGYEHLVERAKYDIVNATWENLRDELRNLSTDSSQ